jgi:hypothetical protein
MIPSSSFGMKIASSFCLPQCLILPFLLLTLLLIQDRGAFARSESPKLIASRLQISRNYGALPFSVEKNQGQADPQVKFLSRGASYSILFKDREAVLLLSKRNRAHDKPLPLGDRERGEQQIDDAATDVLCMQLVGKSPRAIASGAAQLPGTVNYFTGNDSARWLSGIPTFARVNYAGVYPGIDLTYYGNQRRLEFDFNLAPEADPRSIRLRFDGAQKLRLDKDGNLIIVTANGQVGFEKLAIYQPFGDNRKQTVEGSFRILSGRTVSFLLGDYDRTKPLVIDPILNYSTYLGQLGQAYAIAVDAAGEAYVAGSAGAGMPTTNGIQPSPMAKSTPPPTPSAFVAKLNSAGTAVLYCTYLSGSMEDDAYGIALDPLGDAYVAGITFSPDFPVTTGAFQRINSAANGAGFVAAINPTGTALIYSTYLTGNTRTSISGIAVDSAGDAYVTGSTDDINFPTTSGAFQTAAKTDYAEDPTGFVTKLNPTGKSLTYSTFLGGSRGDYPAAIALDSLDNAYIAGYTQSGDFPTTPGAFQTTPGSGWNAFVTKLNPGGTAPDYSSFLGGYREDAAEAIAVDSSGDAYVTGYADSPNFPVTAGVFQPNLNVGQFPLAQNAFVTEFNASGSGLVYSTYLGGSYNGTGGAAEDVGVGIAVDSSGNTYVIGSTPDLDFPVTPGALELQNLAQLNSADYSSFLTKINPEGSQILYSTYLSGSGDYSGETCDCASGIARDTSGNMYLTGWTVSTDFPSTLGAFQTQMEGSISGVEPFVAKFNASEMTTLPTTTTTLTANSNGQEYGQPVTFTATVTSTSGSTPTGTVGFSVLTPYPTDNTDDSMGPWVNVSLNSSGVATYSTSNLITGQIPVVGYYLGDAKNAPSTGTITENVSQIPTTTTITSSANPVAYGQPLTLTISVVETATGTPAKGTLIYGTSSFGEATLDSSGQYTWTADWSTDENVLPVGADTISATFYPAGPIVADQTSTTTLVQTITSNTITPAPTFSPPAGTYNSPQVVTINDTATGAVIYFSLDGTTPQVGAGGYDPAGSMIGVDSSETVEALAQAPGEAASSVVTAVYVINPPQPDFFFVLNPTSLTVYNGNSGTASITVSGTDGFTGSVSFACSGLPTGASCSFSPDAVTPGSSSTMTIAVPASAISRNQTRFPFAPVTSLALALGWFSFRRRLRRLPPLIAVLAVMLPSLSGCGSRGSGSGGGGGQNSQPVISTVTVTATSGSLSHTATLTLTVN